MRNGMRSTSLLVLAVLTAVVGCGDQNSTPESASSWVGRTYLATPADPYTYLTSPSNSTAAKQLAGFIPNFLLKVTSVSAANVAITIAPAKRQTDPPEQDFCNPTVDAVGTVASYPSVQIGPIDLPLYITNPPSGEGAVTKLITVREFQLADLLPSQGRNTESGKFSALVDAREIAPLIKVLSGNTPDSVCAAMKQTFSTDCVPCPDSQVLCLRFESAEFGAEETTVQVQPMSQTDLNASCPKP